MTHPALNPNTTARRLREDALALALGVRSDLLLLASTERVIGREIDRPAQIRLRRTVLTHIAEVKRLCARLDTE